MKAESVQRQNILEWKKERYLEKTEEVQQVIKKSNKERQSARKSINPTKTIQTIDMESSTVISKIEESTSNCEKTDTEKLTVLDTAVDENIDDEKKSETLVLSTEEVVPKEIELPIEKECIGDTIETNDKDIEKVWANIRKDLTVTKIDVVETKEKILEDEVKNVSIEKLEPPEEEEPSDWEDQEAQSDAENEPVNDSVVEPKENVGGECVLILSDEEIDEEERTIPPKTDDISTETHIGDSACILTSGTEVPQENIPSENNSNSIKDDVTAMEETLSNEDASNSKSDGVEYSESNENLEPEFVQSPKSHDSNHSAEDATDQQEDQIVDSADSTNSLSSNNEKAKTPNASEELTDSTKITIKRSLSEGDEQFELKKPKLDEHVEELNNGDSCRTVENGTDDDTELTDSENKKPSILTHQTLQELITQEICEYMVEGSNSYLVNYKKKYQELENLIDTWKRKAERLQKEVTELRKEQKKLLNLGSRNQGNLLKKGTRTVGISVRLSQDVLTRTVGTNVNLPQRFSKSISPKPPPKIMQKTDSTTILSQSSTTITPCTTPTQEKAPVPMQLIANTAKGSSKITVTTPSSITTKSLSSSISIIDLTREDGESGNNATNSTGGSLASLSGGSVIVSSTPVTRTINIGAPNNQRSNVVAVPLVYTTLSSAMPLLPTVSNSTTTIRASSQSTTAIVPSALNQTPRITYLLPQATASLPVNSTRTSTPSTMATNTRPPMQAIFLRMSSPINPSASTNRFPVQSGVPVSLPSTISVVPVSRSSANSSTLPTKSSQPLQTLMVSNLPVTGAILSGSNTTITTTSSDISQLTTSSKTSLLTRPTVLTTGSQSTVMISCVPKHPAPLPSHAPNPENPHFKALPPKPALKINRVSNGIVLSWNMILNTSHAEVSTYQLFAYQEGNGPPNTNLWKKVGDVKALPLPMACTLTQFVEGHTYHFAVRAVDLHNRLGPFSDPTSIVLVFKHGVTK